MYSPKWASAPSIVCRRMLFSHTRVSYPQAPKVSWKALQRKIQSGRLGKVAFIPHHDLVLPLGARLILPHLPDCCQVLLYGARPLQGVSIGVSLEPLIRDALVIGIMRKPPFPVQ